MTSSNIVTLRSEIDDVILFVNFILNYYHLTVVSKNRAAVRWSQGNESTKVKGAVA